MIWDILWTINSFCNQFILLSLYYNWPVKSFLTPYDHASVCHQVAELIRGECHRWMVYFHWTALVFRTFSQANGCRYSFWLDHLVPELVFTPIASTNRWSSYLYYKRTYHGRYAQNELHNHCTTYCFWEILIYTGFE